jgi:general secretion pathway protein D
MEKILSKLVAQMNNVAVKSPKKGGKPPSKAMVVSDVERNALIVLATGEQIKNIRDTVRKIDIPKVQVYVKARIVEIDSSLAQQVGFKYGLNGGAITSTGLFTLAGNLGAQALQMDPGLLAFLNTNNTKKIPDGTGGYIIENDPAFKFDNVDQVFALGAQLSLLEQNGAAHILSEPSILCTNNKEAEIYVGRTMSILTQAQQSTQGTSNVVNNYSREDIGLTLKVKPRLSSNNKVTLEVVTTIEDVLENESPSADRPTTTKRDVKTTAIVNNGEMIILGGLIKNSGGKGISKVPFLGDIPVLGEMFFTHTSDASRQTNVVIYLTPYIVRRSDELQKLKKHLEKLEAVQQEYNKLIGKVLEEKVHEDLPDVVPVSPAAHRIKYTAPDYNGPGSNLKILDTVEEF